MYKILNLFFTFIILIFFVFTFKYYSSNKNLTNKEFNRNNIDQIIDEKVSNLLILKNDTTNVSTIRLLSKEQKVFRES